MLNLLRSRNEEKATAHRLYAGLMERARAPVFFLNFAVPDTIDGRFDLVALHAALVLERLKGVDDDLAQGLIDAIFIGFDEALRELGVGDMGAGRRLKSMANAFYGRLTAYGEAQDIDALTPAIHRNVYRGDGASADQAARLATYAQSARSHLAGWRPDQQPIAFGPLPE